MGQITRIFGIALIGAMFLIISVSLFTDLDTTYVPEKDAKFVETFDSINRTAFLIQDGAQADAFEFSDDLENVSQATNILPEQSLIKGAGKSIRVLWQLPGLAFNMLGAIAGYTKLPSWFVGMILSLITVTIGALVLTFFFKRGS